MRGTAIIAGAALFAAGCATTPPQGLPPVQVVASGETVPVGTSNEDAADDPAIWRNPANPAASLIVATDKKAGLYVYGLDGQVRSFVESGAVNNVDLVDLGEAGVIVVASDRNDLTRAALQVYRLDPAAATLTELGRVPGGTGEGYGLCLWAAPEGLRAYSVLKHGVIEEYRLAIGNGIEAIPLLTRRVPSQPEGCVVDPRNGTLYVGEEVVGIWRFARDSAEGEMVAPIDNRWLVADVEGLAIAPAGSDGGYLIASSQGDNAYAVFSLPAMQPVGRFAIAAGPFGPTEETDGIELGLGDFGPDYPGGLFVAQDGHNAPAAQNFKLVNWDAIRTALGL
jgi:3-phytase